MTLTRAEVGLLGREPTACDKCGMLTWAGSICKPCMGLIEEARCPECDEEHCDGTWGEGKCFRRRVAEFALEDAIAADEARKAAAQ